jgi:quercetin dioxygenase-like cupin family protein
MGFTIYDYRIDVRNVLATPQIRSRFLKMEPGQVAGLHSHDLGHEVFLVLEGRAAFEIEGETKELGPGQMCVALANEMHSVRAVGEGPMTMYLSVTPHIHPTHTMRTKDGGRLPHRFMPSSAYDVKDDESVSLEELIDRHVEAAEALAEAAEESARIQKDVAARLKKALAEGDKDAAVKARGAMWEAIFATYKSVYDLGTAWNNLAPRAE